MNVTLTRNAYSKEMGTFGELVIGDEVFQTLERPWINNQKSVSCIPEGEYECHWLPTTTAVPGSFNDKTWYLIGGSVGYDVGQRTRIACHIGNYVSDLKGCLAFGLSRGLFSNKWGISNSGAALERMRVLLPDIFTLDIRRSGYTPT